MAGRGRGFAKRGLNPKDVPCPTLQPPSLYPPLQFKPVSLLTGSDLDYMLALKQEFRVTFKESGFDIPKDRVKNDIERYSDKYYQIPASDQIKWDKSLFPKELFAQPKHRKIKKVKEKSSLVANVVEKLTDLEAKEETEETEDDDEKEEELEEESDDEAEEETDYGANYFDNGENYLDDEDDNLEEACDY